MEKIIKGLLIRSKLDFGNTFKDEAILNNTARSWSFSLTSLKYNFSEKEWNDIYLIGLNNNMFQYGFNLQTLVSAAKEFKLAKKQKEDRKLI